MFYAVMLSPLRLKQSSAVSYPFPLFGPKTNYGRAFSLILLVNRIVPGIADRLCSWMHQNNRFPWLSTDIKLIASGSGAAVFRLGGEYGDKVLRLYRRSLGKNSSGLLETARYYKRNYETVLSWYGSMPDLVLPMEFMVLEGLPLIGPVAASLQPYICGNKHDLFEDYSDDELWSLLEANDHLRHQFIFFAKQTICQWSERKVCYDLLGRENVMLVNEAGNYRLYIVDVGLFKLDKVARKYPEKISQIEQRVNRLAALYERLTKNEPVLLRAYSQSQAYTGR